MVIDTSIFIEHLRSKNKSSTTFYNLSDQKGLVVSAVTVYELYLGATNTAKQQELESLLNNFAIIPFTQEVAVKAAYISAVKIRKSINRV